MISRVEEILKDIFGYDTLRAFQKDVINSILDGNDNLVIAPTGAGKSLTFQLPAFLLPHPTIVISPLVSLIQDQVYKFLQKNINNVAFLSSSLLSPEEYQNIVNRFLKKQIRLLYITPETFVSERFLTSVAGNIEVSHIVIDEAHCVEKWGRTFRPSYLEISKYYDLFGSPILSAYTATASPSLQQKIISTLKLGQKRKLNKFIGEFDRPNIYLETIITTNKYKKLVEIIETHKPRKGEIIVYANDRKLVERLAFLFSLKGFVCEYYHGQLGKEQREEVLQKFLNNELDILFATSAFGMGIDKPNIRLVIHYLLPLDVESYYQEIGRAGRDGEPSSAVLLYEPMDEIKVRKMLNYSYPEPKLLARFRKKIKVGETFNYQKFLKIVKVDEETAEPLIDYLKEMEFIKEENGMYIKLKDIDIEGAKEWRKEGELGLQKLLDLILSYGCKRKKILEFFGEKVEMENCNNCSFCKPNLGKNKKPELLILKNLVKVYDGIDIDNFIKILQGDYGNELLVGYARFTGFQKTEIKELIFQAVNLGYFNISKNRLYFRKK